MWKQTKKCIEEIESLLQCTLCEKTVSNPHGLGSCEHFFCSTCIAHHIGESCPVCHIPSYAKNLHFARRIAEIVQELQELKDVIQPVSESKNGKDNCQDANLSGIHSSSSNSDSTNATESEKSKSSSQTSHGNSVEKTTKSLSRSKIRSIKRASSDKTINRKNAKGETPLHLAAIKGDVEKVATLLKQDANPNVKDNAGWTPLHEACSTGSLEVVRLLLDGGANVNTPGDRHITPLHDAVECGWIDIVELLMTRGANPNCRNLQGYTAFDLTKDENMRSVLARLSKECTVLHEDVSFTEDTKPHVFLFSGLNDSQKAKLRECAKLMNAVVASIYSTSVTHLITTANNYTCTRTLKFLFAIITGKWIVGYEWIEECLKKKSIIAEDSYEVNGSHSHPLSLGPKKSRMNFQQQKPGLFSGCHFYFHGQFSSPSPKKEDLIKLVKLGGGVVLSREPRPDLIAEHELTVPYHAPANSSSLAHCSHFIIYQDHIKPATDYKSKFLKSLHLSWLLECISQFEIIEPARSIKHF